MKNLRPSVYRLMSSNRHLLNIFEENYYIELGLVDHQILKKLLNGVIVDLNDIFYREITTEGVGKITTDSTQDISFQLLYLLNMRQRSSSFKLFFTCGVIRYLDKDLIENYAPIVLIPIEIDIKSQKIFRREEPIINTLLFKKLAPNNNALLLPEKINSIMQIDRIGQELARRTNTHFSLENFLTYAKIEYRDAIFPKDFFEKNRSIYDFQARDLISDYLYNIHSILPTNIYQKHILLRVVSGANFGVDGKLVSGKTHTIMNIISDKLLKGKSVLYVNHDIDNICDVARNFKMIGLSGLVVNMVKMIADDAVPRIDISENLPETMDFEPYQAIYHYEEVLNQKINGYSYKFLLEELAIIKNTYPLLETIELEFYLEKFENEKIVNSLLKIENLLNRVDPYASNLWSRIEPFYSFDHIPEITKYALQLEDYTIKIYDEMKRFAKKYGLHLPDNIRSVHQLIASLSAFLLTPPPLCWSDSFQFDDAHQAVIAISVWQEKQYELTQYYKEKISNLYVIGTIEQTIAVLYDEHYTYHDHNYINLLLSKSTPLQDIVDEISMHRDQFYQVVNQINELGKFNKLPIVLFSLFEKIGAFFTKTQIPTIWLESTSVNHTLETFEKKAHNHYQNIIKLQTSISDYFIQPEILSFALVDSIITSKRFVTIIKRYLKPIYRKGEALNQVIGLLEQYHTLCLALNSHLAYSPRRKSIYSRFAPIASDLLSAEGYWNKAMNFLQFIKELSDKERHLYFRILDEKEETFYLELLPKINAFNEEVSFFEHAFAKLRNFRIIFNTKDLLSQLEEYKAWEAYLIRVLDLKEFVNGIFNEERDINLKDLLKLKNMDNEYIILKQMVEERRTKYTELLGELYDGLQTNCIDVSKLIDHFDNFAERLINKNKLSELLNEKKMKEMANEYFKFEALYEGWIVNYRHFNRYFHRGLHQFNEITLKEAIDLIGLYTSKLDQMEPIFEVTRDLHTFASYGLNGLAKGIKESHYHKMLATRFIYSTYLKLKDRFEKENELYNKETLEENLAQCSIIERKLCEININILQKEAKTQGQKLKNKLENIPFYNYQKLIEAGEKYNLLYLADINIFNGPIDLSSFDTVIIDDGHLSSAHKYHRIVECQQVVVFGDSSFRSSISNNLMKRIDQSSYSELPYRYLPEGPRFNNHWSVNNQYIYEYSPKIAIMELESISDFAFKLAISFYKNQSELIDIVIANEQTQRIFYSEIVLKFRRYFSNREIIEIMTTQIRIMNAKQDGTRYVHEAYIYFPDIEPLDEQIQTLIFKNYTSARKKISFVFLQTKNQADSEQKRKKIRKLIGKSMFKNKESTGIATLLIEKLNKKDIKAQSGFGALDVVIKGPQNVGLIILERNNTNIYSVIDTYQFYYEEFIKNGWYVQLLYASDLFNSMDEIVDDLVNKIKTSKDLQAKAIASRAFFGDFNE